jgi:hypothetical protein
MFSSYPKKADFFLFLVFLYFFTLHADRLHVIVGGFTLRFNNFLAFLLLVMLLVRYRQNLFIFPKKLIYPLLGIVVSLILSYFASPYKNRCVFFIGWFGLTVLCYIWLPYFMIKLLDEEKILKFYCLSFVCVGCYAAFQLILSLAGIQDPFAKQFIAPSIVRPNAFCYEPSFYALYMTPFVFLYNAHFVLAYEEPFYLFKKKSPLQAFFINLLYVLSTSTSVFFAYVLFFVFVFLFYRKNRKSLLKWLAAFCAFGGMLTLFSPFLIRNFFLKFFYSGFMAHHSFYERMVGLLNGWKIFCRHPIFGVGLGGYQPYLMEAYLKNDRHFTFVRMHQLTGSVPNPLKLFEAMSTSTELLASLGVMGCLAFGYLLLCIFNSISLFKKANAPMASSFLVSLAVTLCVLQCNQGLLRTYIWTHLALTFAYLEKKYVQSSSQCNFATL